MPVLIRTFFRRIHRFFSEELWLLDTDTCSLPHRGFVHFLKVVCIVVRGFIGDQCTHQASALTFITMLSIVPVLALAACLSEMLGMTRFEAILRENIHVIPPQVAEYLQRLLDLVEKTSFLAMGIAGILFLLWIYIRGMYTIEDVFNQIWGIREPRKFHRRVGLYIGLMLLVCLMLVLVTSMNALLRSDAFLVEMSTGMNPRLYWCILQLFSIIGVIAALTALYIFMPNTRVSNRAAFGSAVLIGILWLSWQKICIAFQIGISEYNQIYGAFAALPITLYWMYVNWVLVLLGAELCFAFQNHKTFTLEIEAHHISQGLRRRLAFRIMYEIADAFLAGGPFWNAKRFQQKRKIPIRLVNEVLGLLKAQYLIIELAEPDHWAPARDLQKITMCDIELATRGTLHGMFAHVGRLPDSITAILAEHEERYFTDLRNRTFAELLAKDRAQNPNETTTNAV